MPTLLLVGALLCAAPAGNSAKAEAKSAAPSKAKLDKIRKLLHLTKGDQAGENMLANLKQHLPPEQYERAQKLIKPNDLTEHFVEVYDRHFSEADIDGLLAFYGTTLGQRLLAEGPGITQESMEFGQHYAMEKLQQLNAPQPPPADVPAKSP